MIRHEDLFEDTAFFHFHFSAFTDNSIFKNAKKQQL